MSGSGAPKHLHEISRAGLGALRIPAKSLSVATGKLFSWPRTVLKATSSSKPTGAAQTTHFMEVRQTLCETRCIEQQAGTQMNETLVDGPGVSIQHITPVV